MHQVAFLFLVSALLAGCATEQVPTIYQKEDSDHIDYFTRNIEADLDGGSFVSMRHAWFELHASKPVADAATPYMLVVSTTTPDWIFIKSGDSLTLYLDNQEELHIVGTGSEGSQTVISGDMLDELSIYYLSLAELKRISQAKQVRFKLTGSEQILTGSLGANFLDRVRLFAAKAPGLIGDNATQNHGVSLGISYTGVTVDMAAKLKMDRAYGAFVVTVEKGSFAERMGILPGDVILVFDRTIESADNIKIVAAELTPTSKPSILVWREGKSIIPNLPHYH